MARDPLAVLWRLRDAAVTEASRELAAARAREAHEAQRLDEHGRCMAREQSEAGVAHAAAFAAWLPRARQQADRLRAGLLGEATRVARLQQVLAARRIEAEAVAKALQRQEAEAGLARARRDQAVMDEVAGRRRNGSR